MSPTTHHASSSALARRSVAAVAAPIPAPEHNPVAATIAILQRELDALRQQVEARPPTKVHQETETQERLLSVVRSNPQPHPLGKGLPSGMWLTDVAEAASVTKGIAHTQLRKVCYRGRCGMSLERDDRIGKLAFWVSLR